jgi:hypothetical protein
MIDPQEFGRLCGNVESILEHVKENKARLDTVEDKVEGIQRWQAYIIGGFTAVGGILGAFMTKASDVMHKIF